MMEWLAEHLLSLARTPWGPYVLFFHSIGEACIWWFAPDYILMALCVSNPPMSFWYALLTTVGSTLGGILGYGIGRYGGRPILQKFMKEETIQYVEQKFKQYEVLAIFIAGFTPIPYKFFALGGGAFRIRFPMFVFITFIARGARFFLSASILYFVGAKVKDYIIEYVDQMSWIVGGIFVLAVVIWQWKRRKRKKVAGGAA